MTRIFFATDVHGSDRCWLKFLNAAEYYDADVIILGGDMTGKAVIPIVEEGDGTYKATFLDHKEVMTSKDDVEQLKKRVLVAGYYPYLTNHKEIEQLEANPEQVDRIFKDLMLRGIESWMRIADQRLRGKGVKCFVCPGNDDQPEIDKIIENSETVTLAGEHLIMVDDQHEMISLGWTNPTPWKTFRECSEEEMRKKIEGLVSEVRDMSNCIFNFHAPPYGSKLDEAPELDENLRPKYGGRTTVHVGSTSVRDAITRYQPVLGLHGHLHESNGDCRIGRTMCINPGSSYGQGVLLGAIINLDKNRVKSYFTTSG